MGPYAIAANGLKQIIDLEFAAESISAIHDRVHESLGEHAVVVGIAPVRESPRPRARVIQETVIEIRFYDIWQKMVNPEQQVNPITVTERAERLRRAIEASVRNGVVTSSGEMWFFHVESVDYPDDPTGNKTRFVMVVRAWGNNPALVETVAP